MTYSYKDIMVNHKDKVAKRKRANSSSSPSSTHPSTTNTTTTTIHRSSSKILADTDRESGEFDEPSNFSPVIEALGERNPVARDSQDILRDAEAVDPSSNGANSSSSSFKESANDVIAKDAYLLLRAYCKLAMKPVPDSGTDLKSQVCDSSIEFYIDLFHPMEIM